PLHLMRGAVNTVSMLSFFMAMSLLPLADASALTFTGPLFAAVMAVALFREPIKPRRVVALAVGFGGALVVLRPGFQEIGLGQVMILTSVLLWSFVLMMLKSLSRTEASLTITVYMGLIVTPFSLIAAVFVWQWPTAEEWAWLGFIGLCGTIGQVAFVQALKEGDVGLVLPLDFTKLIWMAGFGYLVFGEVPDLTTILGGVAIGATATYLAVSEAREERRAKPNAAGDQQR
ncbi:MAG: DMT family transporter, partial [Alphaproteobacteria bacterium]|nr:DMT family transporter [Alphaproteobacteria bacterium]